MLNSFRSTGPVLALRAWPPQSIIALVARLRIERFGTQRGPFQDAAPASGSLRLAAPRDTTMGSASLAGCSILICEDEPLAAIGIADAFTDAGARVVTVHSLANAMIAVERGSVGRHPGSRAERWREFAAPRMPKGAQHPVRAPQWVPRRT